MKILFIDTETTGFLEDPNSKVIEFGCVVWDSDKGIIASFSFLINSLAKDELISNEINELTGIDTYMVRENGMNTDEAIESINSILKPSVSVCAANSKFDEGMLKRLFKSADYEFPDVHWIDFLSDIEWPKHIKGRSVNHIGADHGIVNPFPHRAVTDCFMLISILERGKYDIEKIVELSKEPQITVKAVVSFDQKDAAKKAGFYWNSEKKFWWKNIRESQLEEFKKSLTFQIIGGKRA